MRWTDERFMWDRDGSYPNPQWLDTDGKTRYPLPSDAEPMYSSFTRDGKFPLYTCSQCGRRLRWLGEQTTSKTNEFSLLELLAASSANNSVAPCCR